MKNFIKYLGVLALGAVMIVGFSGCGEDHITTGQTFVQDATVTDQSVKNFNKTQPLPVFTYSQERDNLIKRLKMFNQSDVISYITLMSFGRVVRYCVVKGKVSSLNSLLTNPQQPVPLPLSGGGHTYQMAPSPDLDGSYGDNPRGIFFWTADGEYVEWSDSYLLSNRPQTLSTPPLVVVQAK